MRSISIFLLAVLLVLGSSFTTLASFTDIQSNWAREAIINLDERGMLDPIITSNDNFLPNDNITREEAIEVASRVFELSPTDKQNLYTWLDHFLPMDENADYAGDYLTRGELTGLIAKLLGLTDSHVTPENLYPTFIDVDKDHPAYMHIELVNSLGILPSYIINRFEPSRLVTRAEAAHLLDSAMQLNSIEGKIADFHHNSNRILVETLDAETVSLPLQADTLVFRNGMSSNIEQLETGDSLFAIYDTNNQLKFVNVVKESELNTAAILKEISNIAQNLTQYISPDEILALVQGDWSKLTDGLRSELFNQLIDLGLTPWEADSILSRDWEALQDLGLDRLAYEASDFLGLTPELVFSIVERDWEKALEYAQVELAQRLLTGGFSF